MAPHTGTDVVPGSYKIRGSTGNFPNDHGEVAPGRATDGFCSGVPCGLTSARSPRLLRHFTVPSFTTTMAPVARAVPRIVGWLSSVHLKHESMAA